MFRPTTPSSRRARPAFTLIEVLIVVAIIGLMASITLGVSRAAIRRIYEHRTEIAMRAVFNKVKQHRDERGAYPPVSSGGATTGLVAALNRLEETDLEKLVGPKMFNSASGVILDQWGNPIRYYLHPYSGAPANVQARGKLKNNAPILISAGTDTQFGTIDDVMVP